MNWHRRLAAAGAFSLGLASIVAARPDERPDVEYRWELAIPDHLPPEARHPQHLLSGRNVRILPDRDTTDVERVTLLPKDGPPTEIIATKKREGAFTIELPIDLAPGNHLVTFGKNAVTLPVAATTPTRIIPISPIEGIPVRARPSPYIARVGCEPCYWEAVLWQDPNAPERGALLGSTILTTTIDSWRTFTLRNVDALTRQPAKPYFCDPKIATLPDGRPIISGLTNPTQAYPYINAGLWIASNLFNNGTTLDQLLLEPATPAIAPTSPVTPYGMLADYTKVVVDTDKASRWSGSIYVSGNAMYFPGRVNRTGLFVIRNNTTTKLSGEDIGLPQPPQSGIALNGVVHFARDMGNKMMIYSSEDGGASFRNTAIADAHRQGFARVSTTSNRGQIIYRGPELAADKERGILYAAWADFEKSVPDPNFEYAEYGMNYDLFLSRSFDNGKTWGTPVKVNDDVGTGDQGFPSIIIDRDGTVIIAYHDHRNRQDQAVFDVMVATSKNFGVSFNKSYQVNDFPIPNLQGGRGVGDYNDKLGASLNEVFIFHPCVNITVPANVWNPNETCVARIPKYFLPKN